MQPEWSLPLNSVLGHVNPRHISIGPPHGTSEEIYLNERTVCKNDATDWLPLHCLSLRAQKVQKHQGKSKAIFLPSHLNERKHYVVQLYLEGGSHGKKQLT